MCPRQSEIIWEAEPHTIAKITILKNYLFAWFQIFGRTRIGSDLLYVDGFAGPGHYANHSQGSPLAALMAAREVLATSGRAWKAGDIHCAFIEADRQTANHLEEHVAPLSRFPRLRVQVLAMPFAQGLDQLKEQMPNSFLGPRPLFVFIDPFGPTGVSFAAVREILGSPCSEVLVNFDADGIVRILQAGASAKRDERLTDIFGDESWRALLDRPGSFRELCLETVALYKMRLRALPNVPYIFSFEMLTARRRVGQVGYFLVFAGQHPVGLRKMKGAMRTMTQDGTYQFSNARVGQQPMFRYDRPQDYSLLLHTHFVGRGPIAYSDIDDFALNETPFENPKAMLRDLEEQRRISVVSNDPRRRKGTFNEAKVTSITFLEDSLDG